MRLLQPLVLITTMSLALAGCAPTPTPMPTPTPTPVASSASPSATPTPAAAGSVVFGGDCSLALADSEVADLLGSDDGEPSARTLTTIEPDLGATLALIGGVSCGWLSESSFLGLAVFPAGVVPSAVADATGAMSCDESAGFCSGSTVVGATWVYAYAPIETAAADALERVAQRVRTQTPPAPEARSSDWWSIPPCSALNAAVLSASGLDGLEEGFPGDSLPSGVSWDTAVANGVTAWCPWYALSADEPYLVELDIQPGVGVPDDALLAEASATAVEIPGADHGFLIPSATSPAIPRIVAVSGPNRLTVTGRAGGTVESLSAVAVSVLAALNEK